MCRLVNDSAYFDVSMLTGDVVVGRQDESQIQSNIGTTLENGFSVVVIEEDRIEASSDVEADSKGPRKNMLCIFGYWQYRLCRKSVY